RWLAGLLPSQHPVASDKAIHPTFSAALVDSKISTLSWIECPAHGLTKINIRVLPLRGRLQSDLIRLEHRTPGVGVENGITPCRLSACSMLSSVAGTTGALEALG